MAGKPDPAVGGAARPGPEPGAAKVEVHKRGWLRRLLAFVGPAYLVSVGYMDPGNWATDIEGGARFGYLLLWVLLLSNLMAVLLQTLAARGPPGTNGPPVTWARAARVSRAPPARVLG